jgi:peptide/nickel transport system substrate-binding protein
MRARRMLGAAAVVAVLAAAGCGGGSSGSTTPAGGAIKNGGALRIGTTSNIDSLNPFDAYLSQAYNAFVMEYPQLVQYCDGDKGLYLCPDWASSWKTSSDGLTWTFTLKAGGKWSDGVPLTAEDAAWTGNTVLKYGKGPTSLLAPAISHATSFDAPNATTLEVHYAKAVANVLPQLEQFYVLPEHVWSKQIGANGKGLKTYDPSTNLPIVSGGPFQITSFDKKGSTIYKPNPGFYGQKPHAQAVVMEYFTNSASMVAAYEAGSLDFMESPPADTISKLKSEANTVVDVNPGSTVTNLSFNTNVVKPKNRELLDPKVKLAIADAINRQEIAQTVFAGYAKPWANFISPLSAAEGWVDPSIKPETYDPAVASQMLDSLGYTKGSDGIRVAPATTGTYAQPAHKMSYAINYCTCEDFNYDRQFQIIQSNLRAIGIAVTANPGDTNAATEAEYGPNNKYLNADINMWDWAEYIDPDFQLSVLTCDQWGGWNETGYCDKGYDAQYTAQGVALQHAARQKIVWSMEHEVYDQRPYIQLVDEDLLDAHNKKWAGLDYNLSAYGKDYYIDPHLVG